uniref:Uncharacterized protein n=1 Tax=Parascaris equorum TaxID=6256 RepID=A0A914S4P0_PAREQ
MIVDLSLIVAPNTNDWGCFESQISHTQFRGRSNTKPLVIVYQEFQEQSHKISQMVSAEIPQVTHRAEQFISSSVLVRKAPPSIP